MDARPEPSLFSTIVFVAPVAHREGRRVRIEYGDDISEGWAIASEEDQIDHADS